MIDFFMEFPFTNQLLYIKKNVINILLRNANSEPFKVPVDPDLLGVPQYPKLIKCPMDFGTIKMKLDKRFYQTANECKNDFQDIFRNCYVFNEPGSLYVEMALKLENLFERKMTEMPMPEIYVPEAALQTVKLNSKSKKSKLSSNPNTPTTKLKHKVPGLISTIKTETTLARKRSRSNSGVKEEPILKKSKSGIDLKSCNHILLSLMSKKYNDWNRYFLDPVDVEGLKLHDYCTIVKKPMDLKSIKLKLSNGIYNTNIEFAEDIKLIFKNCYLYNPEGHEVRRCGKLLEGVFLKLYQNSFPHNKNIIKHSRSLSSSNDFQPLLQKILKRQAEIDVINIDIAKRNQEIQESLEFIKNADLIKSFKAGFNGNKKVNDPLLKKTSIQSNDNLKREIKQQSAITPLISQPNKTIICPKSTHKSVKNDLSAPSVVNVEPLSQLYKTNDSTLSKAVRQESSYENPMPGQKPLLKSTKNDVDNLIYQKKSAVNVETYHKQEVMPSLSVDSHQPPPSANNIQRTVSKNIATKAIDHLVPPEAIKNTEEFNTRLGEIKVWIGSQTDSQCEQIKEYINKSEGKVVSQVNLLKLKPSTINGLYTMMKNTPKEEEENIGADFQDFSNEDRMKLSHNLSILGDRYSEKILRIYKKTESVESHDGECEIDFQKMKLVTLHRLKEFADKYLQKRDEKQKRIDADGDIGDDSDSDSSDSSDSNDLNSNASSNSSSDGEFLNSLPKPSETLPPPTHQSVTAISPTAIPQKLAAPLPPAAVPQTSSNEAHLSDSSDSDDDDHDVNGHRIDNGGVKRPLFTAPWNQRNIVNDVRSPSFGSQSKLIKSTTSFPMAATNGGCPIINKEVRSQLDETLRQIVQDNLALVNVKKQEEELRCQRLKEEEEQKRQHLLKVQQLKETKKKLHSTEQMKKDQEINKLRERAMVDMKQRNLDIPQAVEREDYHQLLCDFEYNIDHNLIMKLVHSEPHQVHL